MATQQYRIGFVGIGLMGKPMTLRLLAAGFQVNVWNRSADKLTEVAAAGAQVCASIAQLVQQSNVILLCLADTAVVEDIVTQQIQPHGRPGQLLIDMSSIHPQTTRQLAEGLQQHCGMHWAKTSCILMLS